MYCIIYRFMVKEGREERFAAAWGEVTDAYAEHCGGLGSRLHRGGDREFIAYAQWPDQETRDRAGLPEAIQEGAAAMMRGCCESVDVLYEMVPVDDRLVQERKPAAAKNPFQHIDLRVRDHDEAWEFYSKILPAIGFEKGNHGKTFSGYDAPGRGPGQAWFGFTGKKDHRANHTRIAFWAESRERVDAIAELARKAGARNVSGPKACPDYSATYYAVFFEDPSGNRLEVCHRDD